MDRRPRRDLRRSRQRDLCPQRPDRRPDPTRRDPPWSATCAPDAGPERFVEACADADRLLHLSTPGTARLLVVVSEGHCVNPDLSQAAITASTTSAAPICWIAPDNKKKEVQGLSTTPPPLAVAVDDPTTCITSLARPSTSLTRPDLSAAPR
ncbi:hypothetical protein [Micromonospora tulbaghiae]|uniref:hypothetical protein n=1 Tax=Micromonospora tulbaghiae TaxID=479978 RepID=UPI0013C4662C|nr:hypothetical protein [Micromonospora tulbaghiae]